MSIRTDITEQKQNEEIIKAQLKQLEDLRQTLDQTSLVSVTDAAGTITDVNEMFCKVSKYSKEELIGQNHRILKSGHHHPEFFVDLWKTISSGKIWKNVIKNVAKDGSYYWVKTVIVPFIDSSGKIEKYMSIRTDITEQKRNEEQLLHTQEQLIIASKEKEEFSAMISHELKTPLVPIQGYSELLMNERLGSLSEKQKQVCKIIFDNTARLLRLIQDILDVKKMELGKLNLDITNTSSKEIIDQCLIAFKINAQLRGITLVDNSQDIQLQCDPERIIQVINNLLSNSFKFVPQENGKIEVGTKLDNGSVVFSVKDNGIGIPKDKQDNLFKKFYQVDTSIGRKVGGSGLGLVICKGIVESHKGKMWLESELGVGTTIYFSIPKVVT